MEVQLYKHHHRGVALLEQGVYYNVFWYDGRLGKEFAEHIRLHNLPPSWVHKDKVVSKAQLLMRQMNMGRRCDYDGCRYSAIQKTGSLFLCEEHNDKCINDLL